MKFIENNNVAINEDKHKRKHLRTPSCIKMSNQNQHVNGDFNHVKNTINGTLSPIKSKNQGYPHNISDLETSTTLHGGRLKFFKDGKFILELSHQKDGERTCWIPVPKKTYWPAIGTPRQETSTSLSVSDDNSSVQSSPWQRDHCWKQTLPRKNISESLQFYLHTSHKKLRQTKAARKKRRRPFEPSSATELSAQRSDSANPVKIKTEYRTVKKLAHVTHLLWERALKHNESPPRPEIITLRKRILKELEKVSLDDLGGTKRRAKTSHVSPATTAPPPVSKPVSSHSISSILARDAKSTSSTDERECSPSFLRTLLKSPQSDSADSRPSSSSSRPPSAHAQHLPASHPTPTSPLVYHPSPVHIPPHHSPFYPAIPPAFRGPSPLWTVQYLPRGPIPLYQNYMPLASTPWVAPPIAHPPLHSYIKPEDPGDVPLNLSKNAG